MKDFRDFKVWEKAHELVTLGLRGMNAGGRVGWRGRRAYRRNRA